MKNISITDVGKKRKTNQDYVFTADTTIGNLPNLFVVADGMGGHNAGDFASKYTVEMLIKSVESNQESNPIRILKEAIEHANRKLVSQAEQHNEMNGMGTTLVAATIVNDCLYVANIGDSRLYVINKDIRQITKDHSLVEEMIRLGEIAREDARNHPDKNIITRAIGASDEVVIDFFERNIEPSDILLICSDGLTNMIEDKEIKEIITKQNALEEKARELVENANRNGGKDNISVILIEPCIGEV